MSFPRYPNYKASGVEWLGEVPAHWAVAKLARQLACPPCYGVLVPDFEEDGVPMLRITDIELGRVDRASLTTISHTLSAQYERTLVEEGDVVVSVVGTIGKTLKVDVVLAGVNLSRAVARVQVGSLLDANFLCWVIRSQQFERYIDLVCVGTAQRVLNMDDLSTFSIPLPTLAEQAAIVAFLDRETAKIDALVAEQRRLVELLKEKRQAVISHAVTKGLNPAAPMKPSGVEWLGDVPAHWEVRRIASVSTKITNGYVGPTRDIFMDDGVRYLQSLHIKGNRIRFDAPYFVSDEWSRQHGKSILRAGDVLVVQTGDIGQVAAVTEEYAGCNCHALIIVAPVTRVLEGQWLAWILNSDYGFHTLLSIQTGALHPHLNCGDIKDVSVPIPPMEEQRHLIAGIVRRVAEFDTLTAEAERAISLLHERRTALISAAVTGQIDVRGFRPGVAAS